MRSTRAIVFLPLTMLALAATHCGADSDPNTRPAGDGGGLQADVTPDAGDADARLVPAAKVDLLFVIDNSASMGDKQALLATSVGRVLRRLVNTDLHVGIVSTSLGSMGGDVCTPTNPRTNDAAHLLNSTKGGATVPGAEAGFLAFGSGAMTDITELEKAATEIILGVGETGCGLEAQLESMYRFLVQPDPPLSIEIDPQNKAKYVGVDEVLLAQRRAFLRPDSAVAIVMLTDEDDSAVDPMSLSGQGWAFASKNFPGSSVFRGSAAQGTTAPRGTSACETNPASSSCTSCGFGTSPTDSACKISGIPGQSGPGYDGYYGPNDDELNVRFHRMKERFGVDPQFPIERYVRGLTARKVPNRSSEHGAGGTYTHSDTCTNPLFAAELPSKESDELCNLPEGSRPEDRIFFALIGGVSSELVAAAPDWTKILGANPDAYDETGIDPHMIQSTSPRPGLTGADLPPGNNGSDPVHGREWNTMKADLQYACTFPLPTPRICSGADPGCECLPDGLTNPPLCSASNEQVRGKAYPSTRPLRMAKGLGDRAVIGSICAPAANAGYGPLLDALADKMADTLAK